MLSKKLSDVLELPIKVDVSSLAQAERADLQRELFSVGVDWYNKSQLVQQTEAEEYYINESRKLTQVTIGHTLENILIEKFQFKN